MVDVISRRFFHVDPSHPDIMPSDNQASVDDQTFDADDEALKTLGYRQEFKRHLSLLSIFSLSFSILGVLPSIAATLSFSLGFGFFLKTCLLEICWYWRYGVGMDYRKYNDSIFGDLDCRALL